MNIYDDLYCPVCGELRGGGKSVDHTACAEVLRQERSKIKPRKAPKTLGPKQIDYLVKLAHDS